MAMQSPPQFPFLPPTTTTTTPETSTIATFPSDQKLWGHCFPTEGIVRGRSDRRRGMAAVRMAAASYTAIPSTRKGSWLGQSGAGRPISLASSEPSSPSSLSTLFSSWAPRTSSSEKNDIPRKEMTKEVLQSDVYAELESVRNPSLVYPDYYLSPFHAYDDGNLLWLAAAEAEAATLSTCMRAIPEADSKEEVTRVVRGNWVKAIQQHHL